ncbi:DUF6328 family protein [Cellulomonas sp. NS3]|uniref:DUF6328 family protein n=1 Tax=Cellulomonas sp. NS3 TaxID=2973977 RepID=UPI00216272F8|nr:DUF6328 family protein [Cellulomonas sp. NS3]
MVAQHELELHNDRRETRTERMDRNWNELLQELRVTQTGVQILTGFLLTVPFQQRFGDLDEFQRAVYLVLVALALVTTGLITAPVSLHRILFRKGLKPELVEWGDRLARAGLAFLALVLTGAALLLFDFVVDRTAGYLAGGATLVFLGVIWLVVPLLEARKAHGADDPGERGAGIDD